MRNYILGISGILLILTCSLVTLWKDSSAKKPDDENQEQTALKTAYINHARSLYQMAHLNKSGLSFQVFEKALTGYYNLKRAGLLSTHARLTIADFDQPSTKKRLYLVDLEQKNILLNTWVAHGQRSGEDQAVTFSNQNDSFSSSIGFYVTGEAYIGMHGMALRLNGMDPGFNDNARSRAIVIHGAPYVSENTILALGRLGRSQGCPAVSPELADSLISSLGKGSVLFINKSAEKYTSSYLDAQGAYFAAVPEMENPSRYGSFPTAD